ncbi:MAG: pimeloyl-ACP methyl ester esterase BioH [Gammaproteobacteria bacterium]|nr:pimeloyl-ACP methyl ester esterase BioH [Gammaproteobacteria bacterium]
MNLHFETSGTGPGLVLLHGWGMHSGVWHEFAQRLAQHHQVTLIDLPGHGRSSTLSAPYTLANVAQAVLACAPPRAHWLGWSLGGLIAQHAAHHAPERVAKLALLASSPQFLRSADWPHAMDPEVLAQFSTELQRDYRATVLRFLALEVQGSAAARDELRTLREVVFAHGEPRRAALLGGLEILRDSNLRAQFAGLLQPVLMLLGSQDRLVPPEVAREAVGLLPSVAHMEIAGAGHAPFLSQPALCAQHVMEFIRE